MKAELRTRAERLRRDGWSVPDIAVTLGVAKSTAFRWVRHLPLDKETERARTKRQRARLKTNAYWSAHRQARELDRRRVHGAMAQQVGQLTQRELLLVEAVAYWCEGAKSNKPWRSEDRLIFTNSDPVLVELFVALVEVLGVPRAALKYRVSIHESADAARAAAWWASQVGVPAERFQRPTLKRHNPKPNRHNVGDSYRGCLIVTVPRSRTLYWRIEGIMHGLAQCVGLRKLG